MLFYQRLYPLTNWDAHHWGNVLSVGHYGGVSCRGLRKKSGSKNEGIVLKSVIHVLKKMRLKDMSVLK
jgi:hypothetical protein